MNETSIKTVVVTGANSGVGLEAAAQFAQAGYGRVVVTARSSAKARDAAAALKARTGLQVFEPLTLDLDDLSSVGSAADSVTAGDYEIDVLVLNAGMPPGSDLRRTGEGIEATVSATLTGHHLFTMQLLEAGALAQSARILIAGSEAARGDVPMMNPIDIEQLATAHFNGNLEQAIEAVMRIEDPVGFHANNQYATTKVFAAWWAAELARRLPEGMTGNTISPGNTPGTGAADKMPAFARNVLVPIMKLVPGMSQSVADAAGRYLEASRFDSAINGQFFASKPKKMVGPMVRIQMDHLSNQPAQQALWNVTERLVHRSPQTTNRPTPNPDHQTQEGHTS